MNWILLVIASCQPSLPPEMITRYDDQDVVGPIQADEALLLHSIVRTTHTRRILELGGLLGYSARVFLHALSCKERYMMYTVDLVPVRSQGMFHKTIQKDAVTLTMADIDHKPIDLLFLDCHAYYATKNTVENLLAHKMLSENVIIALHDTGKHRQIAHPLVWSRDYVHQPVERIFAQYLSLRGWQRISFHDDDRMMGGRHGLTIMQRPANLTIMCDDKWKRFYDINIEECKEIQSKTARSAAFINGKREFHHTTDQWVGL